MSSTDEALSPADSGRVRRAADPAGAGGEASSPGGGAEAPREADDAAGRSTDDDLITPAVADAEARPSPSSPSRRRSARDPFAEDPLSAAPRLDPSDVAPLDEDPFDAKRRRRRNGGKERSRGDGGKAEASRRPKKRDPFTEDPLSAAPKLDPSDVAPLEDDPFDPERQRRRRERRRGAKAAQGGGATRSRTTERAADDPFAEDPLSAQPKLDPSGIGQLEEDPFDEDDLVAPPNPAPGAPAGGPLRPTSRRISDTARARLKARPRRSPPAFPAAHARAQAARGAEPSGAGAAPPATAASSGAATGAAPPAGTPEASAPAATTRAASATSDRLEAPGTARLDPPHAGPVAPLPTPTTLSSDDSQETAAAPRRLLPWGLAAAGLLLAAGGVSLLWNHLERVRLERAAVAFIARVDDMPSAAGALEEARALEAGVRADPRVVARVAELEAALQRAQARELAERLVARALEQEDPAERLKLLSQAIVCDDGYGRAYVERALVRYAQDRRTAGGARAPDLPALQARAASDLDAAIDRDPQCAWAYYWRARLDLEAAGLDPRRLERVASDLEQVERLSLGDALGMLSLAEQTALEGATSRAIENFSQALARGGDDPRVALLALLGRARVAIRSGDVQAALRDARSALEREPDHARALVLRAEARLRASRDRFGALRDVERALELDPVDAHGLAVLAHALVQRGQLGQVASPPEELDRALRAAERALALDPREGLAWLTRAEVAEVRGQAESAAKHVERAAEHAGHVGPVHLLRGRLLEAAGDADAALAAYDRALEVDPDEPAALARSGALLLAKERPYQARQRLDRALTRDGTIAAAYYHRALIALGVRPRDLEQAQADLTECIALEPEHADAHVKRAEARHDAGSYEAALEDLARAEELGGGAASEGERALLRGHCCFELKRWEEAAAAYERYLATTTERDVRVLRRLADCRRHLGEAPAHEY